MARSTRLIIDAMNLVHRAYHTSAEKLGVGWKRKTSSDVQHDELERVAVLIAQATRSAGHDITVLDEDGQLIGRVSQLWGGGREVRAQVGRFSHGSPCALPASNAVRCCRTVLYRSTQALRSRMAASPSSVMATRLSAVAGSSSVRAS